MDGGWAETRSTTKAYKELSMKNNSWPGWISWLPRITVFLRGRSYHERAARGVHARSTAKSIGNEVARDTASIRFLPQSSVADKSFKKLIIFVAVKRFETDHATDDLLFSGGCVRRKGGATRCSFFTRRPALQIPREGTTLYAFSVRSSSIATMRSHEVRRAYLITGGIKAALSLTQITDDLHLTDTLTRIAGNEPNFPTRRQLLSR